jgi:hypothetical protein
VAFLLPPLENPTNFTNLKIHPLLFYGRLHFRGTQQFDKQNDEWKQGVKKMNQLIRAKYGVSILVLMVLMLLAACTPTGDLPGDDNGNANDPGQVNDNGDDNSGNSNDDDDNANDDNGNSNDDDDENGNATTTMTTTQCQR